MSTTPIAAAIRRRIQERSLGRCEYCLLAEDDANFQASQGIIVALTGTGRVTEKRLKLNLPARVEIRIELTLARRYPKFD